jgi:hypothetical protein
VGFSGFKVSKNHYWLKRIVLAFLAFEYRGKHGEEMISGNHNDIVTKAPVVVLFVFTPEKETQDLIMRVMRYPIRCPKEVHPGIF